MARVEERHWWYRGLRDAVARSLGNADLALPESPRVLDAGCGTGANLRMLSELLRPSYLAGFDASEEALRWARKKASDADLYLGDVCEPEVRRDSLDLIVSLDVIYIPGAERSLAGLKKLAATLRPGGLFVLNLPAYEWLRSEHDLVIHTSQRFTTREVGALLEQTGLTVRRLSYRVFLLFPVVVAARLPGMLRMRRGRPLERSDLERESGGAGDSLLYGTLALENSWIARGGRLPWGSSVFAIGRKE